MTKTTCFKCGSENAYVYGEDFSEPYEFWCEDCELHYQGHRVVHGGNLTLHTTHWVNTPERKKHEQQSYHN